MSVLKNAVQLLKCFTPSRAGLTVTEASNLLGLPKSNVSRLMRSMCEVGMLELAERGRGYRLGTMLQNLGQLSRQTETFGARASAAARRLSDTLGLTSYVSMLVGTHMVGLVHHVGKHHAQVGTPLGARLAVDACATGRAMLAQMSDTEIHELLQGGVSRSTPRSPQDMAELMERVAQTRESGLAESHGEAAPDVDALAVGLSDPHTGERLSLCLTYVSRSLSRTERHRAVECLLHERKLLMRST
jgi:DNA-binding IclR family transcriptional regulator